MRGKLAARHPWLQSLLAHLMLARISNSPTVVSNVLVGVALAGLAVPDARIIPIACSMVLLYTAGMYLNDVLDYETDCRERPERPLPARLLSRKQALLGAGILFACGALLLLCAGLLAFLSGLLLILLIIAYDEWHKGNSYAPWLMAFCRVMVYATAFLALSSFPLANLFLPALLLLLYIVAICSVSKFEHEANSAHTGIAALLLLPSGYFFVHVTLLSCALAFAFIIWVTYSASFAYHRQKRHIDRSVGLLLGGISLFDALVLAVAGCYQMVIVALLMFGLTIYAQRHVRGT
ncbi:prenyltransferase [Ktedonosporobacter rubrisoli]|uniref:Prenyltransferase n=1 Tax=Ktedonosporobacter rubrisoli TaxID=2509675 RepID=A0A4P6JT85_KTERU|nr:UbiA family prenyltransferase [Ktedonosporobacter rubrisoli]QBD78778.1 prenyltransferase [Ktedonosporobacter rubrisoli]